MNYYIYLITPFFTWLVCGITKFIVNCLKERRLAFDLIGYGGMPSNHSAIVSSMASLIALTEGINTPVFGVALTLAFIVILDANSLRRTIGIHALAINKLTKGHREYKQLRECIGHTKLEILVGIGVGFIIGYILS